MTTLSYAVSELLNLTAFLGQQTAMFMQSTEAVS